MSFSTPSGAPFLRWWRWSGPSSSVRPGSSIFIPGLTHPFCAPLDPILTQTAWATLTYNISLTPSSHDNHVSPLLVPPFAPSSNFSDQLVDPTSPLFIDLSVPNTLFTLPPPVSTSASQTIDPGIPSFAYTLGVRPQDLFTMCLILFLGIVAATIVLSVLVWFIDYVMNLLSEAGRGQKHAHGMARLGGGVGTRSPPLTYGSAGSMKELATSSVESPPLGAMFGMGDESKALAGPASPHARFSMPSSDRERGISSHRTWWTRLRTSAGAGTGAFHGSVLHGNLVRLLMLFHLPLTVFSCYQLTLGAAGDIGTGPTVLAALSFVVLSLLLPAHLILRIAFTSTSKLYSETRTLLSLGPLYAHYRAGSQLFALLFFVGNIAFGVVIGAGHKSGTAQAIIILVVEVALALVTSLWLPWGGGASMGLISFLFCVARIVVAVLLVILTQAVRPCTLVISATVPLLTSGHITDFDRVRARWLGGLRNSRHPRTCVPCTPSHARFQNRGRPFAPLLRRQLRPLKTLIRHGAIGRPGSARLFVLRRTPSRRQQTQAALGKADRRRRSPTHLIQRARRDVADGSRVGHIVVHAARGWRGRAPHGRWPGDAAALPARGVTQGLDVLAAAVRAAPRAREPAVPRGGPRRRGGRGVHHGRVAAVPPHVGGLGHGVLAAGGRSGCGRWRGGAWDRGCWV